jgi:hypothetical protein
MSKVLGKNVTVYVYRDILMVPTPVFAGCATSCSKDETAEDINITTADSGRENEYIGGSKDATGTIDGLMTLDEMPMFQYADWVAEVGNVKRILIVYENSFGDKYSYDANVLVVGVSDQADVTDFAKFTVSWKRSGAATITQFWDALKDSDGNLILDSNGNLIR